TIRDRREAWRAPRHDQDAHAAGDEKAARETEGVSMMMHAEYDSIAALDAIGAADAGEANAFREHLPSCPDCRHARDEYAEAASLLVSDLNPVMPPPQLRERIFSTIDGGNVVDASDRFGISRWWMAAAVLFL